MTKIHKEDSIIYLDEYVYVVDKPLRDGATFHIKDGYLYDGFERYCPIIATNNLSLEGVAKLPDLEEVILHVKATKYSELAIQHHGTEHLRLQREAAYLDFKAGYKAASKKKYSEEDIFRMLDKMRKEGLHHAKSDVVIKECLQSLTPKIKEIELEVHNPTSDLFQTFIPKPDSNGYCIVKNIVYE